jgi:hypothetical protein
MCHGSGHTANKTGCLRNVHAAENREVGVVVSQFEI